MNRKRICALLAAVLIVLCGCTGQNSDQGKLPEANGETSVPVTEQTQPAEPTIPETVPQDGNAGDVTCKGTYSAEGEPDAVAASVEGQTLTNQSLSVWYWAAVAQYRQEQHEQSPDFAKPLDTQVCQIDDSVNSWQQYFLRQALEAWHASQALALQAKADPLVYETAYQPNADTHARCMTGRPATAFLYGYDEFYEVNTMHQAYLDTIPQLLSQLAEDAGYASVEEMARESFGSSEAALAEAVGQYNYAYMYLTFLGYEMAPAPEETENWYQQNRTAYEAAGITQDAGSCVDIRQILLIPQGSAEADWQTCMEEAQEILDYWLHKTRETEAAFSELAYKYSQDPGTQASGGGYSALRQGQLHPQLDDWCFREERQPGDTTILRTEQGVHILYFAGSTPIWQAHAQAAVRTGMYTALMEQAMERFPMEVTYSSIGLTQGAGSVSFDDVLYPDVAHERYPEVPLYLQQDYPKTWFGNYRISTHGCGITTFSMLTTYMSDEEWTPPEMCDLYGYYSFENGTDGMIFINEPAKFGYFFREKTYDPDVAKQALQDGYIVVSIQHKGYWTSGGHYILFERFTEDGMVQVRDSNIANYMKLKQHMEDKHTWFNSTYAGSGYWIFGNKVVSIAACNRCGTPEEASRTLQQPYVCEKCTNALIRRNAYLKGIQ